MRLSVSTDPNAQLEERHDEAVGLGLKIRGDGRRDG